MLPTGEGGDRNGPNNGERMRELYRSRSRHQNPRSCRSFVLFIISPLIAELLLGTTPLTHIGGLVISRAVLRLRGIAHS